VLREKAGKKIGLQTHRRRRGRAPIIYEESVVSGRRGGFKGGKKKTGVDGPQIVGGGVDAGTILVGEGLTKMRL